MSIIRKRCISSFVAHWDIATGLMKYPTIEYASYLEEDGVILEATIKREVAKVTDLKNDINIQQLIPEALAQALANISDMESEVSKASDRAMEAESLLMLESNRSKELEDALGKAIERINELESTLSKVSQTSISAGDNIIVADDDVNIKEKEDTSDPTIN
ncbi:MAG TPA: hypothetical protein VN843_08365 [Anaerolineales bacterium]|nr:hypothetical protein [Anaerolineales bacterium]